MIYRRSIKVPLSKSCKIASFLTNEREFYYRLDVFYDPTWKDKKKRPILLHFTGAGMKGPYTADSSMVQAWVNEGFIFGCVYYHHYYFMDDTWNHQDKKTSRFSYAPYTQLPYWRENFSLEHDYHHHLRMRAYMIESALEYLVEHGPKLRFAKFDIRNIYFTAKSRGGISTIVWSALSECKEWKKYQKFCKGIINSNGFVGSDTLYSKKAGWRNFKNSMQVLSYYTSNTQHIFYHVYNEKDVGNNDVARRLMYCIPKSQHTNHYFTNFTHLGHVTNINYNIFAIKALINKKRCYINNELILNLEEILNKK